jgi:predicted regulator of Ras-like GTPase activity (Roadblock/LC7/MglB family)
VTEAYSTALQITINEFKNITPEITNTFIFKKNGEIIASTETNSEDQNRKIVAAFNDITEQAETIGGVETLTIQGSNSKLSIRSMNELFLATVSSREADEKMVKMLTIVIVPTVVKLIDQIPELSGNDSPQTNFFKASTPEVKPVEEINLPEKETESEPIPDMSESFNSEPMLPEPPVNQFMIERIGGLLVPCDIVRVDSEVIAKWHDIYGDKEITQVHIETLEGKAIICGFKPIKEASSNGKGIIQFPEKVMQALQTSKGSLVIVKPEITPQGEKNVAAKNKRRRR